MFLRLGTDGRCSATEGKILLRVFCSTNRVVCFARGFPFQLGRAGMKTKWSLQFRCDEKGNQSNIPLDKQRKKRRI